MTQVGISRSLLCNKSFVRSGLLAICIFVLLLFSQKLSKDNTDLTDSEHPYLNSATTYMSTKGSQPLLQDRFSIIVSTFNRVEHVHQFLHRYANGALPHLDAVFISWGLGDVEPPEWLGLDAYKVPVYLEKARKNSLTERYRQPAKMRTQAGLWIDDDLEFRPKDIELAFQTYRQMASHQHRIVGFSGRMVNKDPDDQWMYRVFSLDYNMILTNAAFLDTRMLEWFWTEDFRIERSIEYVDEHMNCEDILFNFVVSDKTHLPPILVETSDVKQIATSGISNQAGHYDERTECVRNFTESWGMPLKRTTLKVTANTREKSPTTVDLDRKFRPKPTPWADGKDFVPPPL